jgi:hypothetical protein
MRTRKLLLLSLVALLAAPAAIANHYADFYVIPAAIHSDGANGYLSDLGLQNFQSTPLTVTLLFVESGEGNPDNVTNLVSTAVPGGTVTVPAGGSVILRDVLAGYAGTTNPFGALLVSADRSFAVISRAYQRNATGGTFGQTVQPVRDFIENTLGDTNNAGAVAYVPGLTHNSQYRTNLGFVAGSGATGMTITVELKGADGTSLGTRTFLVPANRFVHTQFSTLSIANVTYDAAGAEFRITGGDGAVTPYASVVDNRTGDAVFINGVFPQNTFLAARTPAIFQNLMKSMKQPW